MEFSAPAKRIVRASMKLVCIYYVFVKLWCLHGSMSWTMLIRGIVSAYEMIPAVLAGQVASLLHASLAHVCTNCKEKSYMHCIAISLSHNYCHCPPHGTIATYSY